MSAFKDRVKRPLLRGLACLGRKIGHFFDRPASPSPPRHAVVIQLGGAGDVVRVFPLLEHLQAAYPQAQVTLLTNQGAELLDLYAGPRRPDYRLFDLRWPYARKLREVAGLRRAAPDLVVSPVRGDGMLECAVLAWLTGAPHRVGFEQEGAGFLHTRKRSFSDESSILDQNLALLGLSSSELRLRLRIPDAARTFATEWYARHVPPGGARVVIHPWASSHGEFRAWPLTRYAELVRGIVARHQAVVVVLGGPEEARRDTGWLDGLSSTTVFDLAGAVRIDEAAALIGSCDLFVGNDSGLLHLALTAEVPAIAVFGATSPVQVFHTSRRAIAVVSGVPCQPCHRHQPFFNYRCDYRFRCLTEVPVSAVLREVARVLPAIGGELAEMNLPGR